MAKFTGPMFEKDEILSENQKQKLIEGIVDQYVARIKGGKIIKDGYSPRAVRDRKKAGLQVKFVDLTGSLDYDERDQRMLLDINPEVKGNTLTATFLDQGSGRRGKSSSLIWGYMKKNYPELELTKEMLEDLLKKVKF